MAVKYRAGSWQMVAIIIMHLTELCMGHHPGPLRLPGRAGEGKVWVPPDWHLWEQCQPFHQQAQGGETSLGVMSIITVQPRQL